MTYLPAHVALPAAPIPVGAFSTFAAFAESRDQAEIMLVSITLAAKGSNPAGTIRLAGAELTDADGVRWDAVIIERSTLDAGGEYLESGWQPPDLDLVVVDARVRVGQTLLTFAQVLARYDVVGSAVVVKLGAANMATAEFPTILEGEVAQIVDVTATSARVRCVQSRKWNRRTPPNKAEKNTYPNLPIDNVGMPLPILFGDWITDRKLLHSSLGGAQTAAYLAGVARGPFPLLVLEPALGPTGQPKYLVSDQPLHTTDPVVYLVDSATGRLAGSSDATVTSGSPSTLILADKKFRLAILGLDKNAATTCDDPQEPLREDKDQKLSGFARLDFDANKKILHLDLADFAPLGAFDTSFVEVWVWYTKNASSGTHPRFGIKHPSGDVLTDFEAAASPSHPSIYPTRQASLSVSTRITSWEEIVRSDLFAEVRAAGQVVNVHRIVLLVQFLPTGRLVKSGEAVYGGGYTVRGGKRRDYWDTPTPVYGQIVGQTPDVFANDVALFTFQKGVKDDGSGTYTGTPSALLQHPGDLAHWSLRQLGGMTATEITTGAGSFGSFVDLRTSLLGYKMLSLLAQDQDLEDWIASIGREALIWFFRRNTLPNQPWVGVPWDVGSPVNYRSATDEYLFGSNRMEVDSLSAGMTSVSRVRNVVRVNYDWDPRLNSYGSQVFISDTDSRGWVASANQEQRDSAADREPLAAVSVLAHGRKEQILSLKYVNDPITATSIRNRFFDLTYRPRVALSFRTFLNAYDLERGMVIRTSSDLDSFITYLGPGSDGSWFGRRFRVLRTTRREAGATTYEVEAVEV
ncbi:MAG: hypothetical protein A2W26_00030 [Acidobacteria bacterium RBG_16_64_8]|nr:MAG: hypothetical protein A2W26_00030 [Acidobacteria bacterium RBG_16_64_8]